MPSDRSARYRVRELERPRGLLFGTMPSRTPAPVVLHFRHYPRQPLRPAPRPGVEGEKLQLSQAAVMKPSALGITALALAAALSLSGIARPQNAQKSYPAMAPVSQYRMASRKDEISLARSAAPSSISADASVFVLGARGYESAATGTNGWVCFVERSWTAGFDGSAVLESEVACAELLQPDRRAHGVAAYSQTHGVGTCRRKQGRDDGTDESRYRERYVQGT